MRWLHPDRDGRLVPVDGYSQAGSRSGGHATAAVIAAGAFVVGIDAVITSGLLPAIRSSLHVSSPVAGQLITAFALSYVAVSPAAARFVFPGRPGLALTFGLAVFAAGNALAAASPTITVLFMARVLAGAGAATFTPTALVIASRLGGPRRQGRTMAFVMSGATLSTVAGVPAGLYLSAVVDWRVALAVIAALAMVACFLLHGRVKDQSAPPVPHGTLKAAFQNGTAILLVATTLLAFAGEFTLYSYLGVSLTDITGVRSRGLPLYYLLFGAAGVVANLAGGWASDRWTPDRTVETALALMAASLLGFPALAGHRLTVMAAVVGCGASAWLLTVPQQRRLLARGPSTGTALLGVNQSAVYAGLGLSGPLGAFTIESIGLRYVGYVAAGLVIAALALSRAASTRVVSQAPSRSADPLTTDPG